jgi:hypothetical protein
MCGFYCILKKVSRHIPVVQIFVHIYYFFRLTKAKNNMEKSLQFCRNIDQEEITNENREIIRNDMEKAERVVERGTRAKKWCK